jgi:hypothetical protein
MRTIIQLLALCGCIAAQAAQQIVVPGGFADVEGNSSSGDLFINGAARTVQVYSASEFNFSGAPSGRIDSVSFRLESGTGAIGTTYLFNIGLSTTTRSPDSLSPVFDENGGLDGITVRAGTLGVFAPNTGASPRPFELRIVFTTPFFYDPSRGNLAVSIAALGSRDILLDAQLASGDSVGRVYGPNALSGTVDSLGLITQFEITPVPEPSAILLGLTGWFLLGTRVWKRRRVSA